MKQMSGRRDSNPLPTAWEAVALPGELLPQFLFYFIEQHLQFESPPGRDYHFDIYQES